MKKGIISILAFIFIIFAAGPSMATLNLEDWAFFIDGDIYEAYGGDTMPATGSLDGSGLGTLSWSTNQTGLHTFIGFFDFEIDEDINTFFNEYGAASGTLDAGQSWEIDEPGWVFGDIYDHATDPFSYGGLDNSNNVPESAKDDVSFALGWDFFLNAGQSATIELILSQAAPLSGFYLEHNDSESSESVFYYGDLDIKGGGATPIPEPSTIFLLFGGIAVLYALGSKKGLSLRS